MYNMTDEDDTKIKRMNRRNFISAVGAGGAGAFLAYIFYKDFLASPTEENACDPALDPSKIFSYDKTYSNDTYGRAEYAAELRAPWYVNTLDSDSQSKWNIGQMSDQYVNRSETPTVISPLEYNLTLKNAGSLKPNSAYFSMTVKRFQEGDGKLEPFAWEIIRRDSIGSVIETRRLINRRKGEQTLQEKQNFITFLSGKFNVNPNDQLSIWFGGKFYMLGFVADLWYV